MPRTTKRSARRAGFTMVEMLVVVTIITILLSLSAAGVLKMIGVQQSSNTKSELTRLQGEFGKQWGAAAHKFQTETLPPPAATAAWTTYTTVLLPIAGQGTAGITDATARARVLWVKGRLKQTFPQTFSEAWNPAPFPALSYYTNQLTALGYSATSPPTLPAQPFESSVCLLWALQRGESNVGVKVEDLGVASSIRDFKVPAPAPAGTTVKGLVDAWNQPIAFCRWPTGSTALGNQSGPQMGYNDPGDPLGLLTNPTWLASPAAANFPLIFHAQPANRQPDASGVSQPLTYRIYPVIASPGPDRKLGLDPTTFTTQPGGFDTDNYYATLATER
jgi:prepilin-type N-terminal cleavage/methylation domain-containing protein